MNIFNYKENIKNYKLLCSIKSYHKKTKYPYSHWTLEKITNTGNMIKLVKLNKTSNKMVTKKKNKSKKGGGVHKIWVF
jgi:hypothetical protein